LKCRLCGSFFAGRPEIDICRSCENDIKKPAARRYLDIVDATPDPKAPVTSFYLPGELTVERCQAELLRALQDKRRASSRVDRVQGWLSRGGHPGLWGDLLGALADADQADHSIWLWSRKLRKAMAEVDR
jgi:hypothetical protein